MLKLLTALVTVSVMFLQSTHVQSEAADVIEARKKTLIAAINAQHLRLMGNYSIEFMTPQGWTSAVTILCMQQRTTIGTFVYNPDTQAIRRVA